MIPKSEENISLTRSLGTLTEYVRNLSSSERRRSILQISGNSKRNVGEILLLNELILVESELILKKKGKKYEVKKGKSDRRKFREGNCYPNSVKMMEKGYRYVEGYITRKSDSYTYGHAWNVNSDGTHFDFTLKDPEKNDYFGIIIPESVIWEVGEKNGKIWYSVLPFIDEEFRFKVD